MRGRRKEKVTGAAKRRRGERLPLDPLGELVGARQKLKWDLAIVLVLFSAHKL